MTINVRISVEDESPAAARAAALRVRRGHRAWARGGGAARGAVVGRRHHPVGQGRVVPGRPRARTPTSGRDRDVLAHARELEHLAYVPRRRLDRQRPSAPRRLRVATSRPIPDESRKARPRQSSTMRLAALDLVRSSSRNCGAVAMSISPCITTMAPSSVSRDSSRSSATHLPSSVIRDYSARHNTTIVASSRSPSGENTSTSSMQRFTTAGASSQRAPWSSSTRRSGPKNSLSPLRISIRPSV